MVQPALAIDIEHTLFQVHPNFNEENDEGFLDADIIYQNKNVMNGAVRTVPYG